MCFSVKTSQKAQNLAKKYGVHTEGVEEAIAEVERQLNAFDHPQMAVVRKGFLSPMRWGLIPHWIADHQHALEIRNKTLNARSESVFEKPSFRDPIRHHRCLVPVSAFYEWQHVGKEKIKYRIEPTDGDVFSLAGVWEAWVSPQQGIEVLTFSVLTCAANPLMAAIHNTQQRMPVILDMTNKDEWFALETPEWRIRELMAPCPEEWLHAVREG